MRAKHSESESNSSPTCFAEVGDFLLIYVKPAYDAANKVNRILHMKYKKKAGA